MIGRRAFIIGGGPSLKGFDGERLRGQAVIAVNNAMLDICPWAEVGFFADRRWHEWNRERLHLYTGPLLLTRHSGPPRAYAPTLKFAPKCVLSDVPWKVGGLCGGASAINIAYLMGAREIVLLGFDMRDVPMDRWREGNYHSDHQKPPIEGQRENKFVPTLEAMAPLLQARGVRVYNATEGSALMCWPFIKLEEFL